MRGIFRGFPQAAEFAGARAMDLQRYHVDEVSAVCDVNTSQVNLVTLSGPLGVGSSHHPLHP